MTLGCVQALQRMASGLDELVTESDEEGAQLVQITRAAAGALLPPLPHPDPTL